MTKEALQARIDAYRSDMEATKRRAEATIQALSGAIQDCEYWLSVLAGGPAVEGQSEGETVENLRLVGA